MLFLLIWLISVTDFIFDPMFKYIGAVAFPFIAAGILYYLTRPILSFLERFKVYRTIALIIIFILILFVGLIIVRYISPFAQYEFINLMRAILEMVEWAHALLSYWHAELTSIANRINE